MKNGYGINGMGSGIGAGRVLELFMGIVVQKSGEEKCPCK